MNIHTPVGSLPQAFVKIVPSGGTKNAAAIKKQLEYLGRDGNVPIERSVRHFGDAIGKADYEQLAQSWSAAALNRVGGVNKQDLTTHIVVSFPAETNHENAKNAGRAWAQRMFGHGEFGGKFDYVTTFHTDTAHPHLHVIVNRRATNNDTWLKISKRDPYMNYENMRNVLVEKAAQNGVFLEATSREARGLVGNPLTLSAYYMNAKRDVFFSTQHADNGLVDPAHYAGDDANVRETAAALAGNRRIREADIPDGAPAARKRRTKDVLDQNLAAGPAIPANAANQMDTGNSRRRTRNDAAGSDDASVSSLASESGYNADTPVKRSRREGPNDANPNPGRPRRSR